MSWIQHVKSTQKKGESYKDAMKRASATWTKKERIVKKADASLKKVLKKEPKEPKKEKKPRKVKIVEPTSVKVESITQE